MRLWTKVISISITIPIAVISLLTITSRFFYGRNYTDIETDIVDQNLQRVENAIQGRLQNLERLNIDWAAWDDSYAFMADGNQDYIDINLVPQTFSNLRTNLIAYTDTQHKIVWAKHLNYLTLEESDLPPAIQECLTNGSVFYPVKDNAGFRGILRSDSGPMLFSAQPILTSNLDGPARGFLFMGYYLDDFVISELADALQLPILINCFSSDSNGPGELSQQHPSAVVVEKDRVIGSLLLADYTGNPCLVISTEISRMIYNQGLMAVSWFNIGIVAVAVVISLSALWVVKVWIIDGFQKMEQAVADIAQSQDFTMRVPFVANGLEMERLESGINRMLERFCETQCALKESEARYSAIVENMSDGVVVIEDGVHKYVNPRVPEVVGLGYDEIIGKPFAEWIAPECKSDTIAAYKARIAGADAPEWYESKILHNDGHRIPVDISAKVIEINGKRSDIVILHDNTQHEKMEQALRESEARHSTILENMSDGVTIIEDGLCKYINKRFSEMVGMDVSEAVNRPFINRIAPECRETTQAAYIARLEKKNAPVCYQSKLIHKDGHEIPVEISAGIITVNGIKTDIVLIHDITERDRMEKSLQESEARYRLLAENSADVIWLVELSQNGSIKHVYVSPSVEKVLGYTQEEYSQLSEDQIMTSDSFSRVVEKTVSDVIEFNETGTLSHARPIKLEMVHKNGAIVPVEVVTSILPDEKGKAARMLGISRDISESKKIQEELVFHASILENVHDGVIVLDSQGKITYWNDMVSRISGYDAAEMMGKIRVDIVHGLTDVSVHEILHGVNKNAYYSGEWEVVTKYGDTIWVGISIGLMKDYSGQQTGYVVMVKDITARKVIDEELRSKTALLEAQLNSTGDGILVTAEGGAVVWENEINRRIWGFSHSELKFDSLEKRVEFLLAKVKSREQFIKKARAVDTDAYVSFKDEMELSNGIIMERYTAPVLGKDGRHYGRIWSFHDVTDYKKIEAELRSKTAFLEAQLHSSTNGVLVVDQEGRVLLENEANVQLWKFSHKNLEFTTLEDRVQFLSTKVKAPLTFYSTIMSLMSSSTASLKDEFELLDGTVVERYSAPVIGENGINYGRIWLYHDITGLKTIENDLRAKTALLEAQLNASTDGVLVADEEGRVILENESNKRLWGFSHKDLVFTGLEERIQHLMTKVKDPAYFRDKLLEAMTHPEIVQRDELELLNGTYMERYSAPVLGDSGRHYGRIWAFHDITERKKAEEVIRESENRYRMLAENSTDVIWTASLDGRFTFISPSVLSLRGYTVEEAMEQTFEEAVTPSSFKTIKSEMESALKTLENGLGADTIKYFEVEQPCKTGSNVWTGISAKFLLDECRQPVGIIGVSHDVTQRKKVEDALRESERQLAAIIQFLPVATMVVNLMGEVVAWNKAMENLTGIKACDILGKGDYEYALPFYGERRPILIDLVMHPDDKIMQKYTVFNVADDGIYGELTTPFMRTEDVYLYAKASLLRNSKGEITGAIESVGDITETKKSEKMAKASLKEKETLLKEIHHRVKNNMQVISSLLALQAQFVHAKEDEQLFQDSQDRIRSMTLVYNKLYQSKTLATICMKGYVEELATNLVDSYSFARERIDLKMDVGEVSLGIEHAIPCGLIINELLVNSMKHAFPDGCFGEINISMHQLEKTITIEVGDNGVGLPQDFDIAASPTLGVGLVHSLGVDQLGGSVEFTRLEQGTRVAINFSLNQGMG